MTYGHVTAEPGLARDWKNVAACAGYPDSLFFPSQDATQGQIDKAKAICSVCEVNEQCMEYALETNQRAGIWGGTTEDERRSLRRKWLATRRRPA